MKVDILGTEYDVKTIPKNEIEGYKDLHECDGFCEQQSKEIIVKDLDHFENMKNVESLQKSIIRHEIIHAFLYESGLDVCSDNQWARNEEIVDWIAIQTPKLLKVFEQVGAI